MRWAFLFLAKMLETVLGAHEVGIAHRDGHMNNWFLTRNPDLRDPTIGLGDWGISKQRNKIRHQDWFNACHQDFRTTAQNLNSLVMCQHRDRKLNHLLIRMNNALVVAKDSYRTARDLQRLANAMEDIRASARQEVQHHPRPSHDQEALIPHDTRWDDKQWTNFSDVKDAIRRDSNLQKLKHFQVAECRGKELKVTGKSNDHFEIVKHGRFR